MFDIITIGSATRDVFLSSNDFKSYQDQDSASGEAFCFEMGSKVEAQEIFFATGGGGTNTAATFAKLGLKCACISKVGDDPGGQASLDDLNKFGVNTKYIVKQKAQHTAYSVIISAPNKDRAILVYRGASKELKAADVPFSKLKTKWLYITSIGGNVSLLNLLTKYAAEKNIKTAFNPGSRELEAGLDKLKYIIEETDVLFLNQKEAAKLTGYDVKKIDDIVAKLSATIKKGIIVITRGPEGLLVVTDNKIYVAGILGGPAVERSGAGDAFGSGFITGMILQDSIEYAIQLGSANATSVIQHLGTKNGLLNKEDLDNIKKLKVTINQR